MMLLLLIMCVYLTESKRVNNVAIKIMIDPYFSNSVKKINPKNYRRIPVNDTFLV